MQTHVMYNGHDNM